MGISKNNNSGIISLNGFAYQIRVFVYYMSKLNENSQVEFETIEDVAISRNKIGEALEKSSENFRSLLVKDGLYEAIQVKRTLKLSRDKIIFNWLLLEKSNKNVSKYILFTEGNNEELFEEPLEKLFDKVIKSKKKSTALITQVKNHYKDLQEFESDYKAIREKYTLISENNLNNRIMQSFNKSFHSGGVSEYIYKLRVEQLLRTVTANIMDSIERRSPYICTYFEMMKIIEKICNDIGEEKQDFDYAVFKKGRFIDLADESISSSREYNQLIACELEEKRVEEHLMHQQYYEDMKFRYYENSKINQIENIESTAYENFCDVRDTLEVDGNDSPRNRLLKTKGKSNYYTPKNQLKSGVCIHLTSNEANEEYKISWKD